MSTSRCSACALMLFLAAAQAQAQSVIFTHASSLYTDAQGEPLRSPEGVGCDDQGRVVVADTGNRRLLLYSSKEGRVSGGTVVKLPELPYPVRVELDGKGNALVLDRKRRRIARVDPAGVFQGYLDLKGVSFASTVNPASFKLDGADNVYLLDLARPRVLVLDPSGMQLRTLDLPGKGSAFTDLGVDPAGTVYVVDALGGVVWSAAKEDKAFKPLSKSLKGFMNFAAHLTVNRGRLFLVDQHGNGVVILGLDGSYQGRQLSIGWGEGLIYYPAQLCIDRRGAAWLADRNNHRIQLFNTAR